MSTPTHTANRRRLSGIALACGALAAATGLGLIAAPASAAPASAAPGSAAPSPAAGLPSYELTDLGTLPGGTSSLALGIGVDGSIVGTGRTGTGSRPQYAIRWSGDEPTNLGSLPGSTFSRAFAVNSRGQAVGEAFTAPPEVSRAVLWEADGTIRDLGTRGGSSAVANDIDARGRAFGVSSQLTGPSVATVWDRTGPTALPFPDPQAVGSSRATAVSRSGRAVGSAPVRTPAGSSIAQAARWTPRGGDFVATALDPLEPGRFAVAYGVAESGPVVGEATRLDPGTTRTSTRAVAWDDTEVRELGPLGAFRFTRANDVSNRGDVVGFASGFAGFPTLDGAAVLWREDQAIDLNTTVTDAEGFVLRSAEAVDERGRIVGFGTRGGQNRAFLLTPR